LFLSLAVEKLADELNSLLRVELLLLGLELASIDLLLVKNAVDL
jgi:hypothetical protein